MQNPVVKTLKLSLPFPPAMVNAYLIDTGRNRILFDTGAKTEENFNLLKQEIEKFGGIDGIVLSHGHLDHSGLAKKLSQLYDIPVYASFYEKERLSEDFQKRLERRVKKTIKVLNFFSFSVDIAKRELEKAQFYKEFMEPLNVIFNFSSFKDSEINILELPGHTKGSIALFLPSIKTLLTGDAFLKDGVSSFFDPESPENTLMTYFTSIDKLLLLKPEKIYPGHGKAFDNPASVASAHKNYVTNVTEKIKKAVEDGLSFKDLLPTIYPPHYNALIAISEIIYALESINIEILQNLRDLLSE